MGTIAQLLKYKAQVSLLDPKTGKELDKIWIRILGDEAIKDAYKYARVASAHKRAALKDTTSIDYQDEVASLDGQDVKDLYELVMASRENDFTSEAVVVIQREELPEIANIAAEPDAPTLEEQEVLDAQENDVEARFLKKVNEYVATKKIEVEQELKDTSYENLVKLAQEEIVKVIPMQVFIEELRDQKGFRASFTDKDCKIKVFSSIEEYKDAHAAIKLQIINAYDKLELGPDEIKN